MTKEVSRAYLVLAIDALRDMHESLDSSTPDAQLSFLEAALDAQDLLHRAIFEALQAVAATRNKGS